MKKYFNRGLVLIYPGHQNEAKLYQYNRLIEEFEKRGIIIDTLKVDEVIISVEDGKFKLQMDEYDFCIQLVKDKYINEILTKNKIRAFNTYAAIENCDDKMMAYTMLSGYDIKMPSTISGNTNLGVENITNNPLSNKIKDYVENTLGYPLIVKKGNSKGGRDIHKIDDRMSLDNICNQLKESQYLFQEFVSTNTGKDIRVIVIGGKVVESFMRMNENDFRSNISLGGKAFPYVISKEHIKVAEKVAKILELDYCSVDFFITEDTEPMICEVNADPALRSIEELSGKNIAKIYADHIINQIYE